MPRRSTENARTRRVCPRGDHNTRYTARQARSHAGANKSGHCQYGGVIRQHGKPLPLSSSAFTIGRLCKALHVSFDQCFGIEPDEKKDSPEKENALLSEIEALQEKCDGLKQELERKEDLEKLNQRYLSELERSAKTHRKFSRWMAGLCTLLLLLFLAYLIFFDLPNPEYGIIRSEAFLCYNKNLFIKP